jgi:hypothetical protein
MKFKQQSDMSLFFILHPALIMIFSDLNNYAYEKHGVQLVITDTVSTTERDSKLKRLSPSHVQRRAIDIRANDLPVPVVKDLVSYINNKSTYERYRYLANSGVFRLAVDHGTGDNYHIHLAIHSKYSLKPLPSVFLDDYINKNKTISIEE